jgi:hypothetical protein
MLPQDGLQSTARQTVIVEYNPKSSKEAAKNKSSEPTVGPFKSFHEKAGQSQVETVLFLLKWILCLRAEPPLSPSFHPQSVMSDVARCKVGVLNSVGAAT